MPVLEGIGSGISGLPPVRIPICLAIFVGSIRCIAFSVSGARGYLGTGFAFCSSSRGRVLSFPFISLLWYFCLAISFSLLSLFCFVIFIYLMFCFAFIRRGCFFVCGSDIFAPWVRVSCVLGIFVHWSCLVCMYDYSSCDGLAALCYDLEIGAWE